jgi:hypothetical protein
MSRLMVIILWFVLISVVGSFVISSSSVSSNEVYKGIAAGVLAFIYIVSCYGVHLCFSNVRIEEPINRMVASENSVKEKFILEQNNV